MLLKKSSVLFAIVAIVLIVLGLLIFPAQAESNQWIAQSSGVLTRLLGVFFADRNQGWIVGSNGLLLTTKDGGIKWERKSSLNREVLRDVRARMGRKF